MRLDQTLKARRAPARAEIAATGLGKRLRPAGSPSGDGMAEAFRQAGAVLLGKLATHEFAHGGPSFDLPWQDIVDAPSIIKLFHEHPSDIPLVDTVTATRMQEAVALLI